MDKPTEKDILMINDPRDKYFQDAMKYADSILRSDA